MPTCKVCDHDIRDAKRSDAKYHPECRAEYKRLWHLENKARMNDLMRTNYRDNEDTRKEYVAQYKKDNRDKVSQWARTRNRKLRRVAWASRKDIDVFYIAAKKLTEQTGIQFSVDHVVPLTGDRVTGLHCPANLQIITLEDNLKKYNSFVP